MFMSNDYAVKRQDAIQQLIAVCNLDSDKEILEIAIDALMSLNDPDILKELVELVANNPEKDLLLIILQGYVTYSDRSGMLTLIISEMPSNARASIISQVGEIHKTYKTEASVQSLTAYLLDHFYYNDPVAKKIAAKQIVLTSREAKYLYSLYIIPFGIWGLLVFIGGQTGCLCNTNPLYPTFGVMTIICLVLIILHFPIRVLLKWTRLYPKILRYTVFLGIFTSVAFLSIYLLSLSAIFR